ncbi:hypothetical protein GCM10010166_67730 [Couchioplanes caeruleus subsp. azureus]|nr:hypothetical protein GCM10010166_67730 [Couchioplanes caeruleus subsp. azureus]
MLTELPAEEQAESQEALLCPFQPGGGLLPAQVDGGGGGSEATHAYTFAPGYDESIQQPNPVSARPRDAGQSAV